MNAVERLIIPGRHPELLANEEQTGLPVVGLDHDNTIVDEISVLIEYLSTQGIYVSYEDFNNRLYHEIWGCSEDRAYDLMMSFHETEAFLKLPMFPDVKDGINHLRTLSAPRVLTARPLEQEAITREWYDANLPNVMTGYDFTGHYYKNSSGIKVGKGEVSAKRNTSIVAEDTLLHAYDCLAHNVPVVLIDRPWNQAELPSGIVRVRNFSEATEVISGFLQMGR